MRIVIDINSLRHTRVGLPTATYNLVRALIPFMSKDELLLLNNANKKGSAAKPDLPPHENPNVQYYNLKISRKILEPLWSSVRFPKLENLIGKFDVYHSPAHGELPLTRAAKVLTIHDLYFLKGDFFSPSNNERLLSFFKRASKSADIIIADSNATRDDIIEHLHAPEDRVKCVYLAASHIFKPAGIEQHDEIESARSRHGLSSDFILFAGGLTKIKNVSGLVKAYNEFRSQCGGRVMLALGGILGDGHEDILAAIKASPFANDIRYLGYIPEEDIPLLMNAAKFFVFPSFFEGFGLPILEAMACGTPVITGNRSSMAEIAGDAALLVSPENTGEIASAMALLNEDERLRNELSQKGLARSAEFSWEKCAKEILAIYHSLA